MLGDFVKGKKHLQFPEAIQKGILHHRFIDRTTDEHPIVHEAMAIFKPSFYISNGVFVDIFFDHFLANDARYFSVDSLGEFTQKTYDSLLAHHHLFDEKMNTFFSYMQQYNWLYYYKDIAGIERSIRGICKRHPRLGDAEKALEIFSDNYQNLQSLYADFFPVLLQKSRENLEEAGDK